MPERKEDSGLLLLIDGFSKDVSKLDDKLEKTRESITEVSNNVASMATSVKNLADDVATLTKVLLVDNGKPSLLSEVAVVKSELQSVKSAISKEDPKDVKDPTKVAKERWKAIGKVAAVAVMVGPGIYSFLHTLFAP